LRFEDCGGHFLRFLFALTIFLQEEAAGVNGVA